MRAVKATKTAEGAAHRSAQKFLSGLM